MKKDFDKSKLSDEEAIRDYNKQIDELILEKQKLEEQNRSLEKEIQDQRNEHENEIKAKKDDNNKKMAELDRI